MLQYRTNKIINNIERYNKKIKHLIMKKILTNQLIVKTTESETKSLPKTGVAASNLNLVGLAMMSILGIFGIKKKDK